MTGLTAADNFIGPETLLHRLRERAMLKLLADYGRGNYLDVGCGTGLIFETFARKSRRH